MASDSAGKASRSTAPGRAAFKHWARIPIRYTDLDTLGHVNNVSSAAYIEQARCELIYPIVKAAGQSHLDILVVRVAIEYLAEVTYPGTLDIGTVVTRIGSKSFELSHAIFAEGAEHPSTTADTVGVWFDLPKRLTVVPSPAVVAELSRYLRSPA